MAKQTVAFRVRGMTCANCARHVEAALREVPGVLDVRVDLGRGRAEIDVDDPAAKAADLRAAVEEAGYEAVPS